MDIATALLRRRKPKKRSPEFWQDYEGTGELSFFEQTDEKFLKVT